MYSMSYEQNKNVFHIVVSGFFKEEDGLSFLKYYNDKLKKFNIANTTLIIESQNLKASAPNMLKIMKQCYQLYNHSGFKKMIIVLPSSPTSALQAKRMAQDAGYLGNFANSLSEAYAIANT
jgi:hypothetical protein